MNDLNKLTQTGRLTMNPELKYTPSGSPVCNFSIAVNSHYKDKAGNDQQETCFIEVVTFGKQAESCNEYLKKGSNVLVDGKLQLDQWENNEGQKRSKHRFRAMSVRFLDPVEQKEDKAHTDNPPESRPQEPPQEFNEDIPF